MHSLGIDHSDLKPANILLSPSGSARIIDIGIVTSDDLCYETWPRPELLSNLPSFIRYRSFTPATDSWQLASILCMLHLVNKDPDIIYEDQSSSGLLGFKMDNGKYRSHFATLRKAADELEVDFIKRLHAINVRQRLTMEKALQHAYLSGATSPPTRRNKAALSSGLRFSGHH
ncbi:kinase-like domain-containing protein [Cantharellus anzutake]|uniref:kinase-like domain-containing protein n=1 Tax=Cantharellus anzutake TaxID=1750568 RepID=UPI001907F2C9|nr:kinase-like domain-containing protein [Cantharellus anzutake]KAF8339993.1 kinase-like domain-containing protein [Cantharellus anzutake]